MTRSASRKRIACDSCELPFYVEKGTCPYCDDAAAFDEPDPADESEFIFDAPESAGDSRTTCPDCGLPHDGDADGCPYCASSSGGGDVSSEENVTEGKATQATEDEPTRATEDEATRATESVSKEPATGDSRGGGLVGRLRRALGL